MHQDPLTTSILSHFKFAGREKCDYGGLDVTMGSHSAWWLFSPMHSCFHPCKETKLLHYMFCLFSITVLCNHAPYFICIWSSSKLAGRDRLMTVEGRCKWCSPGCCLMHMQFCPTFTWLRPNPVFFQACWKRAISNCALLIWDSRQPLLLYPWNPNYLVFCMTIWLPLLPYSSILYHPVAFSSSDATRLLQACSDRVWFMWNCGRQVEILNIIPGHLNLQAFVWSWWGHPSPSVFYPSSPLLLCRFVLSPFITSAFIVSSKLARKRDILGSCTLAALTSIIYARQHSLLGLCLGESSPSVFCWWSLLLPYSFGLSYDTTLYSSSVLSSLLRKR